MVLETDVDVLVFSAMLMLLPWRRPQIVYLSFIYTAFLLIQRAETGVLCVCFDELQTDLLPLAIGGRALFKDIPEISGTVRFPALGRQCRGLAQDRDRRCWKPSKSASPRSIRGPFRARLSDFGSRGRREDFDVTVVCDNREALGGIRETANLRILRNCHGADYFAQLRGCDAVVVPLAVEDISQGQMVVVQAMAYGKPIIVTRTPTIGDYLIEGEEALMVRRGDAEELRNAIRQLRDDPGLYARIRRSAREAYAKRYSQAAFTRNLVSAITEICDTRAARA